MCPRFPSEADDENQSPGSFSASRTRKHTFSLKRLKNQRNVVRQWWLLVCRPRFHKWCQRAHLAPSKGLRMHTARRLSFRFSWCQKGEGKSSRLEIVESELSFWKVQSVKPFYFPDLSPSNSYLWTRVTAIGWGGWRQTYPSDRSTQPAVTFKPSAPTDRVAPAFKTSAICSLLHTRAPYVQVAGLAVINTGRSIPSTAH